MSYQTPYPPSQPQPQPQAGRRRPGPVTAAALLMFLVAVLAVINAAAALATMEQVVDRFRDNARMTDAAPTDIDGLTAFIRASAIASAVLLVLSALLLIGLAVGILRGSNVARVLTWILSVLGVLCGCCGVLGALGQTTMTSFRGGDTDAQTAEELGRALSDAYPDWWLPVIGGLSGLQMLGYIAIAVLLALPAANAFFRRPAPPQGSAAPQGQPPTM